MKAGQKIEIGTGENKRTVTFISLQEDGTMEVKNEAGEIEILKPKKVAKTETAAKGKKEKKEKVEKTPAAPKRTVIVTLKFKKKLEDKEASGEAKVTYITNADLKDCEARVIKSKVWIVYKF